MSIVGGGYGWDLRILETQRKASAARPLQSPLSEDEHVGHETLSRCALPVTLGDVRAGGRLNVERAFEEIERGVAFAPVLHEFAKGSVG
jgi:hypothetical protein